MELPNFEDIFNRINIIFWATGIPLDDPHIRIRFYFACLCLITTVVGEMFFLFGTASSENILELIDLAPCFCIGALSFFKGIFLAWKHKKIFNLKKCLKKEFEITTANEKKRNLMRNEVIRVNTLIKYYFILNAALITVYNFSTLVFMKYHYEKNGTVKFMLPYAVIYPFEIDTWPIWTACYIQSIVSGFICIAFITMSDALFCVLTSQVCNNLYVLSDEIEHLEGSNLNVLCRFVNKHQYILKLSDDLEDIYTLTNLFNYLVGSLEICALGFSITIGKWSHILGYVLFLLSVLLQILMMSVFGENIIREHHLLRLIVMFLCLTSGLTTSKSILKPVIEEICSIKLVTFLVSHKQQQLTAYKFSVISYASFSKIISTSWSYFTILRTVYKPPENN